jgi:hypothetical protein
MQQIDKSPATPQKPRHPIDVRSFKCRAETHRPKLAITIDAEVRENVIAAAARDGLSVSVWMTMAARETLHRQAGLAAVALWEKQHGRFTSEEMKEARRRVRTQLRTP